MAMFKPGDGRGPAIHLLRCRALEDLDASGVVKYLMYTGSPRGKYRVITNGVQSDMDPQQVNSYIIGAGDAYTRAREVLDKILDERLEPADRRAVLDALDAQVGSGIVSAAKPFKPEEPVKGEGQELANAS